MNDVLPRIGLLGLVLLGGCSATIDEYRQQTPQLRLDQFFQGQLEAHGIVQDYRGRVVRRFSADIVGVWQEGQGILDEQFLFNDGEQQQRCWRLSQDGNRYRGIAGDVIGEARGSVQGNAMNWRYRLRVPVGDETWQLSLDDWLFLVDENHMINRTTMRKFGLPVGEITLHIRKQSDRPGRPLSAGCTLDRPSAAHHWSRAERYRVI